MSSDVQWFIVITLAPYAILYWGFAAAREARGDAIFSRKHLLLFPTGYVFFAAWMLALASERTDLFWKGLLILFMAPLVVTLFWFGVALLLSDKDICEENRLAFKLCWKINRGDDLTEEERDQFERFRERAVVAPHSIGMAVSLKKKRLITHVWRLAEHRSAGLPWRPLTKSRNCLVY